jgi:hypothetical protein
MKKLQDLEGYPHDIDVRVVMESDFPKEQIRDWAIDLLAFEALHWLDYEDETTSEFARAIIASCRPMMETMAMGEGLKCDREILQLAIALQLVLSKTLVQVKERAIELGIREEN